MFSIDPGLSLSELIIGVVTYLLQSAFAWIFKCVPYNSFEVTFSINISFLNEETETK